MEIVPARGIKVVWFGLAEEVVEDREVREGDNVVGVTI
jgi:hypothetical protein